MSENLVACEFEDSTNCVWNAQEQGNGIGESFVDIDGTAFYVEDVSEVTVIECEEGKVPGWLDDTGEPTACVDDSPTVEVDPVLEYNHWVDCANDMVYFELGYWEGEVWVTDVVMEPVPASLDELYYAGCTGNIVVDEPAALEEVVPVAPEIVLPEPVEEVIIEVPVIVDPVTEELAVTGTGDVVVGLLIGLALLTAGVVLFIRGRKNK